jgi:hypothetical protein
LPRRWDDAGRIVGLTTTQFDAPEKGFSDRKLNALGAAGGATAGVGVGGGVGGTSPNSNVIKAKTNPTEIPIIAQRSSKP